MDCWDFKNLEDKLAEKIGCCFGESNIQGVSYELSPDNAIIQKRDSKKGMSNGTFSRSILKFKVDIINDQDLLKQKNQRMSKDQRNGGESNEDSNNISFGRIYKGMARCEESDDKKVIEIKPMKKVNGLTGEITFRQKQNEQEKSNYPSSLQEIDPKKLQLLPFASNKNILPSQSGASRQRNSNELSLSFGADHPSALYFDRPNEEPNRNMYSSQETPRFGVKLDSSLSLEMKQLPEEIEEVWERE